MPWSWCGRAFVAPISETHLNYQVTEGYRSVLLHLRNRAGAGNIRIVLQYRTLPCGFRAQLVLALDRWG